MCRVSVSRLYFPGWRAQCEESLVKRARRFQQEKGIVTEAVTGSQPRDYIKEQSAGKWETGRGVTPCILHREWGRGSRLSPLLRLSGVVLGGVCLIVRQLFGSHKHQLYSAKCWSSWFRKTNPILCLWMVNEFLWHCPSILNYLKSMDF